MIASICHSGSRTVAIDALSDSYRNPTFDLTGKVKKNSVHYTKNGEFSDLWRGEVVEAISNCSPGTKIAIKQLRGAPAHNHDLHKETAKKLNDRGSTWLGLEHENVLKFHGIVYDVGYLPAIVTPYCENGNILEFLNAQKPGIKSILCQVHAISCGLQYLHSKGVVHGDLRAANILVDDKGQPVIADFGLTFVIDHGEFTTNKIAGPARWTAPEILDPPEGYDDEPPYSFQSDIFAFAMTVVEILTGKPPYSNIRNDSAVIFKILKRERPEMPENIVEFPKMQELISSCWKQEAEERPDATHVKNVLEQLIGRKEGKDTYSSYNPIMLFANYFRRFFGG